MTAANNMKKNCEDDKISEIVSDNIETSKRRNFASNMELRIHGIEKRKKPYACSICKVTFTAKKGRLRHMLQKHGKTKGYKCDMCDAILSRKDNLQRHKKRTHYTVNHFKCAHCEKTFKQKGRLKTHVVNVHNENVPYICNECGENYRTKDLFEKHMEDRHIPPTLSLILPAIVINQDADQGQDLRHIEEGSNIKERSEACENFDSVDELLDGPMGSFTDAGLDEIRKW